jgi:hypothetical protein
LILDAALRHIRLWPAIRSRQARHRHHCLDEVGMASPQTKPCMQPIDVPISKRSF